LNILFISHSKQGPRYFNDPSARYRCISPADSLNASNLSVGVIHIDQVTEERVREADALIFHRPSFSPCFNLVLSWAQAANKRCLADYDDLLFAPEDSANSAAVQSGALSEQLAKQYAQDYLSALNKFDECIVSTKPLGSWVRKVSTVSTVHVVPNLLPKRWYAQVDPAPIESRFKQKVLRYLPGTSHHDGDFDFIKPILSEFLNAHPEVTLEVIGPLRFELQGVKQEQIRHAGAVPFEALAGKMADSWVCIAPLLDTSFNQCKSGLKFWESGLYGIPLVASPLPDFNDYLCDGLIEARNKKEWLDALESLLDPEVYRKASNAAAKSARLVLHGAGPNPYAAVFNLDITESKPDSAVETNEDVEISESIFYRLQHQFFSAWFGPGWMAHILKPRIGISTSDMPGEAVDKSEQLKMLKAIWSKQHWSHELYGEFSLEKAGNLPVSLQRPPELPIRYQAVMKEGYETWQEWIDDAAKASLSLWQQQRAPVGSPLMRKWRKFKRSPKHFFEDSNNPSLKWFSRFF
jgi:hypothetical protein